MGGIDAAFDRLILLKSASLWWYDGSAIASGMFDQSDQFAVARQMYVASYPVWKPCDMTGLPRLDGI